MKRILFFILLSFLMVNLIDAHPINREMRDSTSELLTLSGEIIIRQCGQYALINYTRDEAIVFDINVNGYDVLSEEYPYAMWDSITCSYQFDMMSSNSICMYDQQDYKLCYEMTVTVRADGYNSKSKSTYMEYQLTHPSVVYSPPINTWLTPNYKAVFVCSFFQYSNHQVMVDGVEMACNENNPDIFYCELNRLEDDYTVEVSVKYKIPQMSDWLNTSRTIVVPARLYGDLDGDEKLSVSDVALLIDCLLGYGSDYYNNGDVNKNGEITISDVTMLIDKILQPSI